MHTIVKVPWAARRGAAAVAAALALLLLMTMAPTPAGAKSSFMSRTSGAAADTFWTQIDGTEAGTSPFGNVHIGWLYAYEMAKGRAEVFGAIEDYDCEEGEVPGGGHFEDEEEPEGDFCDFKGFRWIEGYDIPFSIDKKLTQARLTGTLTVYGGGHGDGGVVGQPPADIVWSGVGTVTSERHTYRYKDGDSTESGTYRASIRSATMSGHIGPMGFDPDLSGGSITNFKSSYRSRTK